VAEEKQENESGLLIVDRGSELGAFPLKGINEIYCVAKNKMCLDEACFLCNLMAFSKHMVRVE
jgi:hypothetical protein